MANFSTYMYPMANFKGSLVCTNVPDNSHGKENQKVLFFHDFMYFMFHINYTYSN